MPRFTFAWLILPLVSLMLACGPYVQETPLEQAAHAIAYSDRHSDGQDDGVASHIRTLRQAGPAGLAELENVRQKLLGNQPARAFRLQAVERAMDEVSQQRYGHRSGLYWYTDLDEAKKQAAATSRPILSLRMLGKLTEEYSCANSRFFRVLLYADPTISSYLRDNFVLHWQSVRDVPQVTVTLADGSTMRRTVTGNSAHLVMNADGMVVHIIPGLWQPAAFLDELNNSNQLVRSIGNMSRGEQMEIISQWHGGKRTQLIDGFRDQLTAVKISYEDLYPQRFPAQFRPVTAEISMTMAVSKARVEAPLVQPIRLVNVNQMWQGINDVAWRVFAGSFEKEVHISPQSMNLIEKENSANTSDMREVLVQSLASDTAFNRYILGREIHRWFANRPADFQKDDVVTTALYRDIFAMDLNDPWAGLHDPAVYTGLDKGGMHMNQNMSLKDAR